MTTLLTLTDWLTGLNRWQMTLLTTCGLVAWGTLAFLAMTVLAGGYTSDDCDDEEDAK